MSSIHQDVPSGLSNDLYKHESAASAATEPALTHSKFTGTTSSQFTRAQTFPLFSENNRDVLVPENILARKPTVKQEASWFYTYLNFLKGFKKQLVDKTIERTDKFYNWFWSIPFISSFIIRYKQWEKIPVFGIFLQVLRLFLNTRSVILLPFFPVGIVFYKKKDDVLAVVFLFLALMYFAKVLSNVTELASEHFGPVLGALLNATFGNLVELIISGTTVSKDDALLTITSLIGSIISNNLFVIGSCCYFGGLEGVVLFERKSITSDVVFFVAVSLLLSMMSVISDIDSTVKLKFKMDTSQVCAAFIFINYLVYLTMKTNEEFKKMKVKRDDETTNSDGETIEKENSETEPEEELPSKVVCFGALALCIAGLGPTANFFVEALKDLTDDKPISKVFIGLIILPLAGSLPEHISSIISAHKGNLDLSMSLSIGSSNQVIGFVLPIIQFISSNYPKTGFTLYLEDYMAAYLFVTAFVSSLVLINGMLYGVTVFHGTLCFATFGIIVFLTFANDQR